MLGAVVSVKLEAKLRTMRDCLVKLRREYSKLLDERTEYQVSVKYNTTRLQSLS